MNIGTRVKIRKDSEYYQCNNKYNPKDMEGTITQNNRGSSHKYQVTWDNEEYNSYREIDLEQTNYSPEIY